MTVGQAHDNVHGELFPVVGFLTPGAKIKANFNATPPPRTPLAKMYRYGRVDKLKPKLRRKVQREELVKILICLTHFGFRKTTITGS